MENCKKIIEKKKKKSCKATFFLLHQFGHMMLCGLYLDKGINVVHRNSKAREIDYYVSSQETHFQQFLEGLSDLTSNLLSCGKALAKQLSSPDKLIIIFL